MKPASAKAKGRVLQQLVCSTILNKFNELEPDDVQSRSMGANGEDIMLSPAARRKFPFSVECKNLAAFAGYNFYEQAVSNCPKNAKPIAVVKANRKKPLVLIDLQHFMELLNG